jgi:excisionase family DNA binding protein
MKQPAYDDKVERLRSQLKLKIDAAARSCAEVLHVVADLLVEIAQQKPAPILERPEKPETKAVPEMLTTKEAAEYLGVKPQTLSVWRCTHRYGLPAVKIGRCLRYRKSDLDKFIERRSNGFGDES